MEVGFEWGRGWYILEQKERVIDNMYSEIIKFEIFNKKNLDNRKFINKIKKELIRYVRCYEVFVEDVELSFLFKIDNEFHLYLFLI